VLTSAAGRCLSIVAVICVLAMFFFPLAHGSFQATHGPTTTFRAKWAFLVLLFTILTVALRVLVGLIPANALVSARSVSMQEPRIHDPNSLAQNPIMRC
jgi:hypothetical protein